jgi:hypothetical protein
VCQELRHKGLEVMRLHVMRQVANEAQNVHMCSQVYSNPWYLHGKKNMEPAR